MTLTHTRTAQPARRHHPCAELGARGITEYRLVLGVLAVGLVAVLVLMRDATTAGDLARLFGRSTP